MLKLLLIFLTAVYGSYTHEFGLRNARLAAISYCDSENIMDMTCVPCKQISVKPVAISGGERRFIVLDDHEQNATVISFRGSSNVENWIADLDAVKVTPYKDKQIEVHKGFYDDFIDIRSELYSFIPLDGIDLIVVGHSYGAAIAILFKYDLINENIPATLVTFGEPRVGNDMFAEQILDHYRITHKRDMVPHLPPERLGFKHSNTEVWYTSDSEFKVCIETEESNCSNSCSPIECTSIDDHLNYLGVKIGSGGC
jgi:predicted lipase